LPVTERSLKARSQPRQLRPAADEARVVRSARVRPKPCACLERTPDGKPIGFPFHLHRFEPLVIEDAPCLEVGDLADCYAPDRRDRLQPRRSVDDIPCDDPLAELRSGTAVDKRLARVDPDSDAKVEVRMRRVQILDLLEHAQAGANCSLGIVFVCHRCPEDRHHRVTDELLHGPAVSLDLGADTPVIGTKARAYVFRISALRRRGEANEVAEQYRDDLAFLEGRRSRLS